MLEGRALSRPATTERGPPETISCFPVFQHSHIPIFRFSSIPTFPYSNIPVLLLICDLIIEALDCVDHASLGLVKVSHTNSPAIRP